MPGIDGLEATRRICWRRRPGGCKVVILTTFDLDEYVYEALRAGASGFLLKDVPADAAGARDPGRGRRRGAAGPVGDPAADLVVQPGTGRAGPTGLAGLTPRETEVLTLLADGLSNAEIAQRLYVGEATVKTHVARVLTKLAVRDRVQAVVLAYRSGLVRPDATGRFDSGGREVGQARGQRVGVEDAQPLRRAGQRDVEVVRAARRRREHRRPARPPRRRRTPGP